MTGRYRIACATGTRTPKARSDAKVNTIRMPMWGIRTSRARRCPDTPAANSTSKMGREVSQRGLSKSRTAYTARAAYAPNTILRRAGGSSGATNMPMVAKTSSNRMLVPMTSSTAAVPRSRGIPRDRFTK